MRRQEIAELAQLRRARDFVDRHYAEPLHYRRWRSIAFDVALALLAEFRAAYGETPYSYLMTRRIERAKALLREGASVTDACIAVGCTSLGSFSSRFSDVVGVTPMQYREEDHRDLEALPSCVTMYATRPRRIPAKV